MANAHAIIAARLGLIVLCAAGSALTLRAEEEVLQLDAAQTQVQFVLHAALHTVHGTFRLKRGAIHFDPATGLAGGELVIDAKSGDSGSGSRDGRMHRSILESDRYPEITFKPDRIEGKIVLTGASDVRMHGLFRIHGADHELTLPVKAQIDHGQVKADTGFTVPYVRWGMKNPSTFILRVSEEVEIEVHAVGRMTPAAN